MGSKALFRCGWNGALLLFAVIFPFRDVDVRQLLGLFQEFWLGH